MLSSWLLAFLPLDNPEILSAEPGNCPDGSSMHIRSIPMAHGDHNAKHGGILFMAPNGYNHLEGTLDEAGTFRLYLYNDFTKPIDATPFEARIDDAELAPVTDGEYLSASIGASETDPAEHVVHVNFPGAEKPAPKKMKHGSISSSWRAWSPAKERKSRPV